MENDDEHVSLHDRLASKQGDMTAPEELVQVIDRLGFGDAALACGYATDSFDHHAGMSRWHAMLATDSVLIEATAEATRMSNNRWADQQYPIDWSLWTDERAPKSYSVPPRVSVRVRQLANLAELQVAAIGTTDSYKTDELVRETWTFTFRDGTDPVMFEVDHGDHDRISDIDDLCRHLARHL